MAQEELEPQFKSQMCEQINEAVFDFKIKGLDAMAQSRLLVECAFAICVTQGGHDDAETKHARKRLHEFVDLAKL